VVVDHLVVLVVVDHLVVLVVVDHLVVLVVVDHLVVLVVKDHPSPQDQIYSNLQKYFQRQLPHLPKAAQLPLVRKLFLFSFIFTSR
jgi:hypothetical protein